MHTRTVTIEIPVPQPTVSIRTLWAMLVGLAIGDAVTTVVAVSVGLPEANPLTEAAIDTVGLGGILLSQAVYVVLAWSVVRVVDHGQKWVLAAGIIPSALVVVNNSAAIVLLSGVFA